MLSSLYFQLNTVPFLQELCPFRNAYVDWCFLSGKKALNHCKLFEKVVLGSNSLYNHFEIVKKYLKEMESGNINPNNKRSIGQKCWQG